MKGIITRIKKNTFLDFKCIQQEEADPHPK